MPTTMIPSSPRPASIYARTWRHAQRTAHAIVTANATNNVHLHTHTYKPQSPELGTGAKTTELLLSVFNIRYSTILCQPWVFSCALTIRTVTSTPLDPFLYFSRTCSPFPVCLFSRSAGRHIKLPL